MTLKSDAKFKEKLICGFKYDMRNLVNFHPTTLESEIHFHEVFLSKVNKVWTKKMERSYLSWHWKVMQNLNKPWTYGFKNGMRNWGTFIRALKSLKNCTFMYSFWPKHKMFQLENLKGDAKFKGKLTHGLKIGKRNLVNFHGSSRKSEN